MFWTRPAVTGKSGNHETAVIETRKVLNPFVYAVYILKHPRQREELEWMIKIAYH